MCVVPLCVLVVYGVCVCVGGWCKGMDVDVWVFLGCLYVYVCVHFICVCLIRVKKRERERVVGNEE